MPWKAAAVLRDNATDFPPALSPSIHSEDIELLPMTGLVKEYRQDGRTMVDECANYHQLRNGVIGSAGMTRKPLCPRERVKNTIASRNTRMLCLRVSRSQTLSALLAGSKVSGLTASNQLETSRSAMDRFLKVTGRRLQRLSKPANRQCLAGLSQHCNNSAVAFAGLPPAIQSHAGVRASDSGVSPTNFRNVRREVGLIAHSTSQRDSTSGSFVDSMRLCAIAIRLQLT